MNSLDPRLQRLREIEARLAFAEYHVNDQRALVARLTRLGLDNSLAHSLLRSMEDSMAILRLRQSDILGSLQPVEAPQPSAIARALSPRVADGGDDDGF
jgi:hypothetical protein